MSRAAWSKLLPVLAPLLLPPPAHAQLSDPCAAACGSTLVVVGAVAATGAVATLGRITGGLTSTSDGVWMWGSSFAAVVGTGALLSGDGARQERSIYAAAIGSVAGAAIGLAVAAAKDSGDRARSVAAALMGAAVGAVAGGVYGALTHDDGRVALTPSFSLQVSF